jgi:hypothetical protein
MTTPRRRPPVPLAEIRETARARRRVHGGNAELAPLECWGAETTDGIWQFDREEGARTDWHVYHLPSMADGTWTGVVAIRGTLRACRADAANGNLALELRYRLEDARREAERPGGIVWTATFGTDGATTGGRVLRAS